MVSWKANKNWLWKDTVIYYAKKKKSSVIVSETRFRKYVLTNFKLNFYEYKNYFKLFLD